MRARILNGKKQEIPNRLSLFFKCPDCDHSPLIEKRDYLECSNCKKKWGIKDGIYDFREPFASR
jgi:hypothetical protein